jgi:hypothetical protein
MQVELELKEQPKIPSDQMCFPELLSEAEKEALVKEALAISASVAEKGGHHGQGES